MKKAMTVLLSCAMLFAFTGCGAKDATTGQSDQPAASQNEVPGLFHKAESNGIEIVLKASKIKQKPNEELTVQAQIRNTTDKTLFVQTTNGCDPGVRISIPTTSGQFVPVQDGEPQMCTEVMGVKELKPNQTIMNTVKLQPQDIKPGTYDIVATVNLTSMDHGMMNTEPPKVIETKAQITIVE
ncbi:hypothetical protein CBW65_18825 [Tumebacillus avium]|uniref:Intracellular proteinase inhibitor BsuPI domain-containing protein n=1 Tax=Tumebacillus avium TaxID=1903704 RepID=A0A1Y0ITJ9_9BACL|nr:BsuPI-related putative proteinase inhibitor [Tumebacillus avium]ARU62795.1 hypothetical protein CBW65_18825 [Tumebacillus avium]